MSSVVYCIIFLLVCFGNSVLALYAIGGEPICSFATYNPSYKDQFGSLWSQICLPVLTHEKERMILKAIVKAGKENSFHPLLELGENKKCPLFRLKRYNPRCRSIFESSCASKFAVDYPDVTKEYTLIFYNACTLFSEAMIIRRLVRMGYCDLRIVCIDKSYRNKKFAGLVRALSWLFRDARCTFDFYSSVKSYRDLHKKREAERIVSIDFFCSSLDKVEKIQQDLFTLKNLCLKKDQKSMITGIYHTDKTIMSTKLLRADSFGSSSSLRQSLLSN